MPEDDLESNVLEPLILLFGEYNPKKERPAPLTKKEHDQKYNEWDTVFGQDVSSEEEKKQRFELWLKKKQELQQRNWPPLSKEQHHTNYHEWENLFGDGITDIDMDKQYVLWEKRVEQLYYNCQLLEGKAP